MSIKGHATAEGTKAYRSRFEGELRDSHFRESLGILFSSIGLGSYLGEPDDATDRLYEEAAAEALDSGINVLDTAANYRCQRSERSFGRVLRAKIEEGSLKREEVILCTKGGYFPFDGGYPKDPRAYVQKTFIDTGLLKPEDIAQDCHGMTPAYLENQLNQSLANLGVETIDVYYLHNPETQLAAVPFLEFKKRMQAALGWLEEKVKEGKIRWYGTATWGGYRAAATTRQYLNLQELQVLGREAGGMENHFKVVQLPFNFAMPEAWILPNQRLGPTEVSLLNSASRTGMTVIASASLLQAKLLTSLPDFLGRHFQGLETPAQRCLQFVRSVPGITTALVGMKSAAHVRENLEVARVEPLSEDQLIVMFSSAPQ
ncbi:MAG TPA: aldo/keto reductase [Verrucomicrobiae bacterium]|jgi:aryl-alcohol dehydrogenase-like predicted oxidoreductase|nr:aldo/keto reductase [Verrucomicrobiae bacterium]